MAWTKDFPKKDGFYWFYGKPWAESKKDDLFVIQVNGEKYGKIHAQTLGTFVYKGIAKGVFMVIDTPELPTEKQYTIDDLSKEFHQYFDNIDPEEFMRSIRGEE